jgi:adenylate cyclase
MSPMAEADWRVRLDGTDMGFRPLRAFWRSLPSPPRCKLCLRPFAGPGGAVMRMIRLGPWEKNPKYCRGCFQFIDANRGGAEVEITLLFADVRGSTTMAERTSARDFTALMNGFYRAAARELVARDAVVDKFVGDEVVGLFVPGMAGLDHARKAIDAAQAMLAEMDALPIGAGIHTGVAFVGAVGGDQGVTDFTALGDAVNTTARLASVAGAGEILVTIAAASAAGMAEVGHTRRQITLRGRSEPVNVLVIGSPTAP